MDEDFVDDETTGLVASSSTHRGGARGPAKTAPTGADRGTEEADSPYYGVIGGKKAPHPSSSGEGKEGGGTGGGIRIRSPNAGSEIENADLSYLDGFTDGTGGLFVDTTARRNGGGDEIDDEDGTPMRYGCMSTVRRAWGKMGRVAGAMTPTWLHLATSRRSQQSGSSNHVEGRIEDSPTAVLGEGNPGEGYEKIATRNSVVDRRPSDVGGPRPLLPEVATASPATGVTSPPPPQSTGVNESSLDTLGSRQNSSSQSFLPQQARAPRGKGPLIATRAQRETAAAATAESDDNDLASAITTGVSTASTSNTVPPASREDPRTAPQVLRRNQKQNTGGSGVGKMPGVDSLSSKPSSELEAQQMKVRQVVDSCAKSSPVAITVDFIGRSVSVTISGPIQIPELPASVSGSAEDLAAYRQETEDSWAADDHAALEMVEDCLFELCCVASKDPNVLQLHTVKMQDIAFTPTQLSNFSRARGSRQVVTAGVDAHTGEQQFDPEWCEEEEEWMKQRHENIRLKTVAVFNNLVYEGKTVTNVLLLRCALVPLDLSNKLKLPDDGRLSSLSLKECGLSDPHLSALVRQGQRSLTQQRKKLRNDGDDATDGSIEEKTLFGGLVKLDLHGSFSQSSVAVLIRFLRDDQLVEDTSSSSGAPGSPLLSSRGHTSPQRAASAQEGIRYKGMKLQELNVPQQLASFIRSSEFAKRLPMLLINGRGVSVPSSRFGSVNDLS